MEAVSKRFEEAMAYHCAPSMLGIKPADLFTWPAGTEQELETYRIALAGKGICLRCLRQKGKFLLLVYRPERLEKCLACPKVRNMLMEEGYPVEGDLENMLAHLSCRLQEEEFPHEIGLFLGYPPEDVEGFCRHQGQNYKLCGCWKVYGDADAAKRYFDRCNRCRNALCCRVKAGVRLTELFRAS